MPKTEKPTRPLAETNLDPLFDILQRFDEAWKGPGQPIIEDYLEGGQEERRQLLLELVDLDIECRWRAGEAVRVETYFQRYPELGADRDAALRLIETEYSLRRRREPSLTAEEYQSRFPPLRDALPPRLLALQKAEPKLSVAPQPDVQTRPGPCPSHLSCPHCHKAIPLSHYTEAGEEAGSLRQLVCSSCGGSFRFDMAHVPAWSPQALPRLGPFELLNEVGQGAFGTVYRARDTQLGRIVAVKVPRGGRWFTPLDQDRFVREARNVAQLAHPAIVPIYEVGRAAPVPYLVSAYIEGQTLANVLASRRFGFREAAEISAQVAEALEHAHRHGVVHRDLKPSNIMLGQIEGAAPPPPSGRNSAPPATLHSPPGDGALHAFVMDFGLSRRDDGEITVTLEGQVVGTPAYMSPEQARGEGHHVDGRSDVYSLGVILYELLTGNIPFRGVTRMVLQQIQFEEPTAPRRLNDKIPRDLETITLKCMAKEPGRRYASAGEVGADLRRFLKGEPIVARPVGRLERCWRWAKRNPRVAGLLSLVVVLLATVVIGSVLAAIQIGHERDTANAQLKLALDTLDKLVVQVNDELRDKPTMHKLAESLLKTAIHGLKQAAENQPTPHAINKSWIAIAVANQRMGDIYLVLGQTGQAQEYFKTARTQLEAYVAANPKATLGRHDLAIVYRRLGEIAQRKNEMDAARDYFHKALEIDQALAAAAGPRDALALSNLSEAHAYCGDLEFGLQHWDAALRENQKALEIARDAATIEPESTGYKRTLADRHFKVGEVLLRAGKFAEAGSQFEKALQLYQELLTAEPDSRAFLRMVALTHRSLGEVNDRLLHLPEALKEVHLAVGLMEKLAAADPQDARAGRELGLGYEALANVHTKLGDFASVRENGLKRLKVIQHWVTVDRENLRLQTDLASAYYDLGRNEMNLRCYDEAARHFQQGLTILQEYQRQSTLKDQPAVQQVLRSMQHKLTVCRAAGRAIEDLQFVLKQPPPLMADLLYIRAAVLAGRGQHLQAEEAADRLRALDPKNIGYLYDAACAYALCAAGVGHGKSANQLTPGEAAARKRYAARATETLSTLIQLGFQNAASIQVDPDFAAIRQDEDYRKLLVRLQKPLKQTH